MVMGMGVVPAALDTRYPAFDLPYVIRADGLPTTLATACGGTRTGMAEQEAGLFIADSNIPVSTHDKHDPVFNSRKFANQLTPNNLIAFDTTNKIHPIVTFS